MLCFILEFEYCDTATADLYQMRSGKWTLEASYACALMLGRGDFVFYWDSDSMNRKMILADNDGTLVKIGYLPLPATTWENISSWSGGVSYKLDNFHRISGNQGYINFQHFPLYT